VNSATEYTTHTIKQAPSAHLKHLCGQTSVSRPVYYQSSYFQMEEKVRKSQLNQMLHNKIW